MNRKQFCQGRMQGGQGGSAPTKTSTGGVVPHLELRAITLFKSETEERRVSKN